MRGEILFLAHRLPFPPDRGDRIRAHHVLKALAKIAPVHVGCLVDSKADLAHVPELEAIVASHHVAVRSKSLPLAGIEALWRGLPVSQTAFADRGLAAWVQDLLASGKVGAVWVYSGQMGQFVPADWHGPLLVDLCDVDSAKFEAYAAKAPFPLGLVHAREGRLMKQVEAELASRADHTLLISRAEADLFASRAPGAQDVGVLGNGIDADYFSPEEVEAAPEMGAGGPHLMFTGQMDYPPNVAAVSRMARAIMPRVLAEFPQARFHVVGRAPAREVRALDGVNGTVVHGEVPDIRPYLAAADIVTVPLDMARGVQNKVLEAMAMARPVVLSPNAATGIDGQDGADFIVAHDDAAFVSAIRRLCTEPGRAESVGHAARQFVLEYQSWQAMLAPLAAMMPRRQGSLDAA